MRSIRMPGSKYHTYARYMRALGGATTSTCVFRARDVEPYESIAFFCLQIAEYSIDALRLDQQVAMITDKSSIDRVPPHPFSPTPGAVSAPFFRHAETLKSLGPRIFVCHDESQGSTFPALCLSSTPVGVSGCRSFRLRKPLRQMDAGSGAVLYSYTGM